MLRETWLLLTLTGLLAEAGQAGEPSLEEWLTLSGWSSERLTAAASESPLTEETSSDLLGLAKRFERLPKDFLQAAVVPLGDKNKAPPTGSVVALRGEVVGAVGGSGGVQRVIVAAEAGGKEVTVITPAAPAAWSAEGADPAGQPAELLGVVLQYNDERRLLLTPRVEWRPTSAKGASLGAALLGGADVDVGLLDQLADGKPLVSSDTEPFYRTLAACGRYNAGQLLRAAGENLPGYAKPWEAVLREGGPDRALATAVIKRQREGHYSVAPLFNDPINQRGRLFAFEGTARRAVRIDLTVGRDGQPSRVPTKYGIGHYYEIEVFPADSQNLPLVFCVLDLPEGFPTGSVVHERVRVAGFFLKRWAYRTRKTTDGDAGADRPQLAPLLVGPGPVWLPTADPNRNEGLGVLAGVGFVGVLAIVAVALWRQSLGDRRFERAVLSKYKSVDSDR